jgi:DNA-binding transcriptional MocR family regulator
LVHDADVVYCSSFSKTLAAGLRVGWVVPGKYLHKASGLKLSSIIASPGLNQLILAEFLSSGSYGRHLRKLRMALKANMMMMAQSLALNLPAGCRITSPNGGFLVWVRLDDEQDGLAVYEKSLREGVTIMPGRLCATGDRYRNYFRLSCGFPWTPRLEEGLRKVGDVIKGKA